MALSLAIHVLFAVIWVGGMFFAYVCLRPVAAQQLEPPQRLRLWVGVFRRFFPVVWLAWPLVVATGYGMVAKLGGMGAVPLFVHVMNGLGLVMVAIFLYVFFLPWKALSAAVGEERWPDGATALARIRQAVAVNTLIGLVVVMVASGGRFLVL